MKMSFRVDGLSKMNATLKAMPKSQSQAAKLDALLEAAEPMRAVAMRLAPRAPGAPDLADNIEARQSRRKYDIKDDQEMAVIVGPLKGFFYAHFQEYGTVNHGAQPFMRPAFDQNTDRSLKILTTRLWENIQSWLMKHAG